MKIDIKLGGINKTLAFVKGAITASEKAARFAATSTAFDARNVMKKDFNSKRLPKVRVTKATAKRAEARVRGWQEDKVNDVLHVQGGATQSISGSFAFIPEGKVGNTKKKRDFAVKDRAAFMVRLKSGKMAFALRDTKARLPISFVYTVKYMSEANKLQRAGLKEAENKYEGNFTQEFTRQLAKGGK